MPVQQHQQPTPANRPQHPKQLTDFLLSQKSQFSKPELEATQTLNEN